MDKSVFINNVLSLASKFGIKLEDMHVSHGGSMLLLGLKNSTDDIDLTVTAELYDMFYKQSSYEDRTELSGGREIVGVELDNGGFIDVHEAEDSEAWVDLVIDESGVRYRSALRTKHDYVSLGRKSDDVKIKLLDDYLIRQ